MGDRNTFYFHNLVNDRRRRFQVRRIQNADGVWIEEMKQIKEEAIKVFEKQLTQED